MSDGYDELLNTVESTAQSSFIQSSPQQRQEQKDQLLRQVMSHQSHSYHQGEMESSSVSSAPNDDGEQGEHDPSTHHSSQAQQGSFTSPFGTSSRPFSAAVADRSQAQQIQQELPPMPKAGIKSFVEVGLEESDVEYVHAQLDYHWNTCKNEILGRMLARQRRMEEEQRRLDTFRASYEHHLAALQEEVERLKEQVYDRDQRVERVLRQNQDMVDKWAKQHHKVVQMRLLNETWGEWRRQAQEKLREKNLTQRFVRPYYLRRLITRVFTGWRSQARLGAKIRDETIWRNQVKTTTEKLVEDYERNLSELRSQLGQAEEVIRYHREDQVLMEEKLKQAFIRGVCAINREALSVFKDPAEVAEANIVQRFSSMGMSQQEIQDMMTGRQRAAQQAANYRPVTSQQQQLHHQQQQQQQQQQQVQQARPSTSSSQHQASSQSSSHSHSSIPSHLSSAPSHLSHASYPQVPRPSAPPASAVHNNPSVTHPVSSHRPATAHVHFAPHLQQQPHHHSTQGAPSHVRPTSAASSSSLRQHRTEDQPIPRSAVPQRYVK